MPADKPPVPVVGPRTDDGQGAVVAERQAQKTEPPPMYQVILLNDDYTPMEFVVMVLQEYFNRDLETATQIMLKIHHDGRGVCGVYSKDVAGTKVELVLAAARRGGHGVRLARRAPAFSGLSTRLASAERPGRGGGPPLVKKSPRGICIRTKRESANSIE